MSRAFVSEQAEDAKAAQLPERPVSPAPNLVTARGLAQIEAHIAALQAELAAADDQARPRFQRDLRYWRARQVSARLTPPPAQPGEVAFGTSVAIEHSGKRTTWRIVGEDEADPARNLLAWTAPLAQALLGAEPGDTVEPGAGRPPVTVIAVE